MGMSEANTSLTVANTEFSFTLEVGRGPRIFVEPSARYPTRGTPEAAALDLYANLPNGPISISPQQTVPVPTGIYTELPPGYFAFVCSRSGLASKGVFVVNAPGVVDSDYRGEWKVLLTSIGNGGKPFIIEHHDRIAQVIFQQVLTMDFLQANTREELSSTARGEGGFGSTGR
jgi:dUTP pyrophosphatase